MTNAPENFESYVLPDDVAKIEYTPDPKVNNCGVFRIECEDHTLGNLLRMQLIRDRDVVFVGYRHPHPIQHHIVLRVQTSMNPSSGASYSPQQALVTALSDLNTELTDLQQQVIDQLGPLPQF